MKLMKMLLASLLIVTSVSFAEIKSIIICDHNKGEYALAGHDLTKISNSCINCSITGLGGKCFSKKYGEGDMEYYSSKIFITKEGYPTESPLEFFYEADKDKLSYPAEESCSYLDGEHFIEKIATNKFEIRKCYR